MKVKHQALVFGWENNSVASPKTLVLGSFNPYNNNSTSVDYFYGRKTNHFWKSIARNLGIDCERLFGQDSIASKLSIMQNRFVCMDVIDSLEISSVKEDDEIKYINENVFSNFYDSKIWVTKTGDINVKRDYNRRVIDFLSHSDSISKVVHTMGYDRIRSAKEIKPKEKSLGINGFGQYVNDIFQVCSNRHIEFVFETYSPSGYAVNSKKTDISKLDSWVREHILQ
jgi:hypothetical protein